MLCQRHWRYRGERGGDRRSIGNFLTKLPASLRTQIDRDTDRAMQVLLGVLGPEDMRNRISEKTDVGANAPRPVHKQDEIPPAVIAAIEKLPDGANMKE